MSVNLRDFIRFAATTNGPISKTGKDCMQFCDKWVTENGHNLTAHEYGQILDLSQRIYCSKHNCNTVNAVLREYLKTCREV